MYIYIYRLVSIYIYIHEFVGCSWWRCELTKVSWVIRFSSGWNIMKQQLTMSTIKYWANKSRTAIRTLLVLMATKHWSTKPCFILDLIVSIVQGECRTPRKPPERIDFGRKHQETNRMISKQELHFSNSQDTHTDRSWAAPHPVTIITRIMKWIPQNLHLPLLLDWVWHSKIDLLYSSESKRTPPNATPFPKK